jgi:beta-alanine degradation protein BauB
MTGTSTSRRKVLLAAFGSMGIRLMLSDARAQDAAQVMPGTYRVALENDKIRVLDFSGRPGMGVCGESVHSHPAHLTVVLSPWDGIVTAPDGTTRHVSRKVGDVFWSEAETHRVENTGTTGSHVLIVELKSPTAVKR